MSSIQNLNILVGIETDPTRFHGENASRPCLLDKVAAEQVLAHLATDLTTLFTDISRCSLTMAGAVFDQTQVLRPALPVFDALKTFQHSSNPGSDFQSRLLSIGAANQQMPLPTLQPFEDIPLGLLQLLPVLVSGPSDIVTELAKKMEFRFLEEGQLSAHSASALQTHFKIPIEHARFMTLTDINAMLRLQLEHYGFLPLWELLDGSMNAPQAELEVTTKEGLRLAWRDGAVHTEFESFDWWAQHGSGADKPADRQQLQGAYTTWSREYRRYVTMLHAHGVRVAQHLPGLQDSELDGSFFLEESTAQPPANAAPVTEHQAEDLGTVAVTVVSGPRQINFYPLQASGLNDLHRFIQSEGYSGDVAFPGLINYDSNSRQLKADTLPD
jgi:hypothetical protein